MYYNERLKKYLIPIKKTIMKILKIDPIPLQGLYISYNLCLIYFLKMLLTPWQYGISKLNLESFILIMSKFGVILLAMGQLMWFNLEFFFIKNAPLAPTNN